MPIDWLGHVAGGREEVHLPDAWALLENPVDGSPYVRRCVVHVRQRLGASERQACLVLGQPRSTQRRVKKVLDDEAALRTDVIRLASRFGRYGYRQIANLLRIEGWQVNHKRVERIWRQEGLKVPRWQPKRGRVWLNDGSCIRLRPLPKNHVWSYDFVSPRTHDGRVLKLLTVLDEYTRHDPPEHLRSDNGPELTAKLVWRWSPATNQHRA
jgi:putative transposase